jgi:hypothetical protein
MDLESMPLGVVLDNVDRIRALMAEIETELGID